MARLWQWSADRLLQDAHRDHDVRRSRGEPDPDYSISVFAHQLTPEDDLGTAMAGLCALIKPYRSARWVAYTTSSRLYAAGFTLRLNEPPPNHYDVPLGRDPALMDVKGLEAVFCEQERRRFLA